MPLNHLRRTATAASTLLLLLTALPLPSEAAQPTAPALVTATTWPATPPAQICGNSGLLDGPATPPAGAVTVPAGDNSAFDFNRPGATLWFAPGTHTLGDDIYGQIIARAGTTYVGAPGAVLDGQHKNLYAFTGEVAGVTVKYLTIKNFGRGLDNFNAGVVNHDSGPEWTIRFNTVAGNDGAGVFLGSGNLLADNCLRDNGQYGFSMFRPPIEGDSAIKEITLDHNEITGNNTDDWESRVEYCGCTGGGKFWDVLGARVTANWVHDNRGTGLWADTNNIDFLFDGNTIEANDGEGIWYEISYNATIRNNRIARNAWVSGRKNLGSPGPAIYLSESGGDARLRSTTSGAAKIRIYANSFEDNFSGVSIFENANRFCNSNGNTSTGYCTPFVHPTLIPAEPRNPDYPDPVSWNHLCYTAIATAPYTNDCRWRSKNIEISDNDFAFDPAVVPCAGTFCGVQALFATGADNIPWSPYTVAGIQNDVMFHNGNSFHDNRYSGGWRFAKGYGETIDYATWRAAPYNQDGGSTGGSTNRNDLDADTAGLEGSIGQWTSWFGAGISRDQTVAHTGSASLRIAVTDPWGWGVQLGNWPGFSTSPGVKILSLWGKLGSGSGLRPRLQVKWLDANGNLLQADEVALPDLTSSWQQATAHVTAPAGSATVTAYLVGSGSSGDSLYLDDITIGH
ncbi:right-handed parallel beta-helix repeat-containing protein [Kribbella monticola]|uniref:right-handed parallel beta-helix repeat-containing protein n=1 Tax=Kribbella monticola TaxID=2185285 RepID=UPI0013006488|nr:right-handed parallel beta-helix repeat-containing protein [Kribbella monticola]